MAEHKLYDGITRCGEKGLMAKNETESGNNEEYPR
jgi:hypothetical protein